MNLALLAVTAADESRAAELARQLGLPLMATGSDPNSGEADAVLVVAGAALSLQQTGTGAPGPISVDFGSAGMRHRRRSGANEILGKAVGWGKKSPLRVVDGTAGLGRDAFILADLGCQVVLCEREPLVLELLRAGLRAAGDSGDPWLAGVSHRMRLHERDVRTMTAADLQGIDVIYLDPMFPPRVKSAAVKKEMAFFQLLLDTTSDLADADALLEWALARDTARVVVKRPAKAPSLAGVQPSHRVAGSTVRYDVYVRRKLS